MRSTPIKTEQDYLAALDRVANLMDAEPDTEAERELDRLSAAVERYEKSAYADEAPDPVEVIRFYMDQKGLTRSDLEAYLGSPSRVSEVLSGRRELSKTMIRNLARGLGIPSDLLLGIRPARAFELRERTAPDRPRKP
jgi:HTH-type transcriptional regulator / antitoxin HigA